MPRQSDQFRAEERGPTELSAKMSDLITASIRGESAAEGNKTLACAGFHG
jgi:hypothetical protein